MSLDDELNAYTNLSHANAWRRAKPQKPDEPAYVSSLLSFELFRGLREILRNHAKQGTKVLTRGIFTHQTPKVKLLTQTNSIEIGDLMFVHQHFSTNPRNPSEGRALLLQAKRTLSPKTGSLASGTQAIQFELYRAWSKFEGTTRLPKAPHGASSWDFRPGRGAMGVDLAKTGSAFLTIFKQEAYMTVSSNPQWKAKLIDGPSMSKFLAKEYPADCTWSFGDSPTKSSIPSEGVSCLMDFGSALSGFLLGVKGRVFTPGVLTGNDHWSIFVNMMLRESARPLGDYVYTSNNQGIASAVRGRNLGFIALETAFRNSLIQETDDFLGLLKNNTNFNGFEMTNYFIERLENFVPNDGETPPNQPPDFVPSGQGGHIPLLLVITVGDEPQPFILQRG